MITQSTPPTPREAQSCTCGRNRIPKHCPYCGSGFVYVKKSNGYWVKLQPTDESPCFIRGFVCRRCGSDFTDATQCVAPAKESKSSRVERQAAAALLRRDAAQPHSATSTRGTRSTRSGGINLAEVKRLQDSIRERAIAEGKYRGDEVFAPAAKAMLTEIDPSTAPAAPTSPTAERSGAATDAAGASAYKDEIFSTFGAGEGTFGAPATKGKE